MMESDSFLFSKPLLMVAIVAKYFITRLNFKSTWCLNSDFKHTEEIFVKSPFVGERKFLCEIKAS